MLSQKVALYKTVLMNENNEQNIMKVNRNSRHEYKINKPFSASAKRPIFT